MLRAPYGTTRHFVHRPVGRPAAHRARREGRRLGLRRPRARLLGRPLRRRRRARRRQLLPRAARAARAPRPERLGDRQPPRGPGGLRPHRRAPPGRRPARRLGRRRPRGRPPARRREDQGHRARRRPARRDDRHGLHRLADLAPALLVPAQRLRRDRARLRGVRRALARRSSTSSTPRACKFALEVHPTEIAYDFVTTRKTLDALDNRAGLRHQLRPVALRAPVPRQRGVRHRVRRPHLPRPRQGLDQAPRRAPLDPRRAPELRRGGAAAGTSSPPATATSTSRPCSAR